MINSILHNGLTLIQFNYFNMILIQKTSTKTAKCNKDAIKFVRV